MTSEEKAEGIRKYKTKKIEDYFMTGNFKKALVKKNSKVNSKSKNKPVESMDDKPYSPDSLQEKDQTEKSDKPIQ